HFERGNQMQSNKTTNSSFTLSARALLSLFGGSSGLPNPDDSNPPGPWGPVIRRAEERVRDVLGPSPDPWRQAFTPVPDPWRACWKSASDGCSQSQPRKAPVRLGTRISPANLLSPAHGGSIVARPASIAARLHSDRVPRAATQHHRGDLP